MLVYAVNAPSQLIVLPATKKNDFLSSLGRTIRIVKFFCNSFVEWSKIALERYEGVRS